MSDDPLRCLAAGHALDKLQDYRGLCYAASSDTEAVITSHYAPHTQLAWHGFCSAFKDLSFVQAARRPWDAQVSSPAGSRGRVGDLGAVSWGPLDVHGRVPASQSEPSGDLPMLGPPIFIQQP